MRIEDAVYDESTDSFVVDGSPETQSPLIEDTGKESDSRFRAVQKLKWRIAPLCAAITFIAYIDRGNLGTAPSKLCSALNLSHSEYAFAASLFSVGYVPAQIPSSILLKKFGAVRWLASIIVFWGVLTSLLAFVQNTTQLYVLRFLLGVAQGGCFPGCWYYLSTFFPSLYIAFPYALIEASVQISAIAAAPLAAGLLALDGLFGVDGWRLLFFVEGIIPILFGLLLPWILPSAPEHAPFFTDGEKSWLERNIKTNQGPSSVPVSSQFKTVFSKVAFWSTSIYYFTHFLMLDTGIYWTTLIIEEMLHGDDDDDDDEETCAPSKTNAVTAVLLTTVPFTMCAVCCLYIGHISFKIRNRILTSALIAIIGSIFWIIWAFFHHSVFVVSLLALGLALSFPNMISSLVLGVFTCHFDSETRATGLAILNTVCSIGGGVGTLVIGQLVDAYGYTSAAFFLAVVALVSGLVLFPMHDPLQKHNPEEDHSSIEELEI
eukprot:g6044.t1